MIWVIIWLGDDEGCKRPLIFVPGDPTAKRGGVSPNSYLDVLDEGLVPYCEPGDSFMQDNARIHTTKKVKE